MIGRPDYTTLYVQLGRLLEGAPQEQTYDAWNTPATLGSQPDDFTDRRAVRIEMQRRQLFKASAVIEMCRYACASKVEGFDPEQLAVALHVVDDLIDGATEALEPLANDGAARPDEGR